MLFSRRTTLFLVLYTFIEVHAHEESHPRDGMETSLETSQQSDQGSTKPSETVRCVVCSSDPRREGPACITRPRDFLVDCITPPNSIFGPYTGCRRIEQWVDYDLNSSDPLVSNYHRIIRQCAYFGDLKKPCQKDNNIGGRQHVCYCQGVACNESDKKLVIDEVMLATFVIGNTVVLPIILSFKKVFS